jgi:hypothetical protein
MKHLHERMDIIFAHGRIWKHRTLRTIFDPASKEWDSTTMSEKITILKKLHVAGEPLKNIVFEYHLFYKNESNSKDIMENVTQGLIQITEFMLVDS